MTTGNGNSIVPGFQICLVMAGSLTRGALGFEMRLGLTSIFRAGFLCMDYYAFVCEVKVTACIDYGNSSHYDKRNYSKTHGLRYRTVFFDLDICHKYNYTYENY